MRKTPMRQLMCNRHLSVQINRQMSLRHQLLQKAQEPSYRRRRHLLVDEPLRLLIHKELVDTFTLISPNRKAPSTGHNSHSLPNCRGAPRPISLGNGLDGAPKSLVDHQFYIDARVKLATLRICIFGGDKSRRSWPVEESAAYSRGCEDKLQLQPHDFGAQNFSAVDDHDDCRRPGSRVLHT